MAALCCSESREVWCRVGVDTCRVEGGEVQNGGCCLAGGGTARGACWGAGLCLALFGGGGDSSSSVCGVVLVALVDLVDVGHGVGVARIWLSVAGVCAKGSGGFLEWR